MRDSRRTRRTIRMAAAALILTTLLVLGLALLVRHLSTVPPWPGSPGEPAPRSPVALPLAEPPLGGTPPPLLLPGDTPPADQLGPRPPEIIIVPGAGEPQDAQSPVPPDVFAPAPPATDAPGLACSVQRSAPIAFRGLEPRDTLRVAIRGEPCGQANLRIWIEDARGHILYGYTAPFARHVTIHPDDPALAQSAAGFADDVVANAGIAGTTAQLPTWDAARVFYARQPDALKVSREAYDALRARRWPIFWHATGPDRWRLVVYDPELFQPRLVLEGGP